MASLGKKKQKAANELRDVDAPFFGYWRALYLSFFSGRLYVDVAKRWKGLGIVYLLLLITILSLPFSLRLASNFNEFYQDQVIQPLKQIPKFYIQNGVVNFDQPMPYFIKDKAGEVVLIIDTTGKVSGFSTAYPHLTMLITKNQFIYRLPTPHFFFGDGYTQPESPIYSQPFSSELNQTFDGAQWIKSSGLTKVTILTDVTLYFSTVALFFILFLAFYLICTFIAQLVAKLFMSQSLTYKQACRLFIVSGTPAVTLMLFFLTMNISGLFTGLLLILLLVLYFYYAVYNYKCEANQVVVS